LTAATTGSVAVSAATVLGLPSSLEFLSVLFLGRKRSRRRLADVCLDKDWGGVSPVLLGFSDDDAESRLSALWWKVEDRDWLSEDSVSGLCAAWTIGEDVVKYPIWDGCVEMAVGRFEAL